MFLETAEQPCLPQNNTKYKYLQLISAPSSLLSESELTDTHRFSANIAPPSVTRSAFSGRDSKVLAKG